MRWVAPAVVQRRVHERLEAAGLKRDVPLAVGQRLVGLTPGAVPRSFWASAGPDCRCTV